MYCVGTLRRTAWSCAVLATLACGLPRGAGAQSALPEATPTVGPPTEVDLGPSPDSGDSSTELAKKLQNPISDLISVPFQNNTNFNTGPNRGTQDILNIQPVIPFHIDQEWNLITRTILPLVWNPSLQPQQSVPFGTGPVTFSAFLSPHKTFGGWVFGAGPVVQIPTASSSTLGSRLWGIGPTAVAVHIGGAFVYGALVNNMFSAEGTSGPAGNRYSVLTFNPFINYNFGRGWFVGTAPIITANWRTAGDNAWTLPVGVQVGRLVKISDKLPVNLLIGGYYNALRPQYSSTWQFRTQIAFVF